MFLAYFSGLTIHSLMACGGLGILNIEINRHTEYFLNLDFEKKERKNTTLSKPEKFLNHKTREERRR